MVERSMKRAPYARPRIVSSRRIERPVQVSKQLTATQKQQLRKDFEAMWPKLEAGMIYLRDR